MVKKITAPATYNPGKGRPQEHLAYLNRGEMAALKRMNGNNQEVGPSNLPSFPPADAAGSSSKASSTKSSGPGGGMMGGSGSGGSSRTAGSTGSTKSAAGGGGKMGAGSSQSGGTKSSNAGGNQGGQKSSNNPSGGMMGGSGSGGSARTAPSSNAPASGGGGNAGSRDLGIAGVPGGASKQGGAQAPKAPAAGGGGGGGITGIANAGRNVTNLTAPSRTTPSVAAPTDKGGAFGPRADSPQFAISPSVDLGAYVKDQSRVPTGTNAYGATPEQYRGLTRGLGALTQQVTTPVMQGPGVTGLNAPVTSTPPGAFGGFNPASPEQQYAIDRGLIGSLNLRERERANLTVGANSPLADPANQFGTNQQYNPLSSPRAPTPNRMAETYNPLSSVRTPASIAQQQDIANIYGDPTLGNIPLPSGRAFNNTQPVPTPASQYAGYGNFNVPVTPANQQVQQLAKVDAQPVPQAYDPLSSFNRYVAPTVAALEGNTAPQTGPNESTVAKNGTLTREQVFAATALPENNFTIAEPPAISQAQFDAFNQAQEIAKLRNAPGYGYNMATDFQMPADAVYAGTTGSLVALSDQQQAEINRQNQIAQRPNAPYAGERMFYNDSQFANPEATRAQLNDLQKFGPTPTPTSPYQNVTPADPASRPYDIRIPQETVLAVENFPNVPPAPNAPGTPAVTDPLITLPDPAPPTDQYIGPTYPGFDIPGTGGNGGTNFAGPGQGGQGGQQIVPTAGPPPTTPTNPTPPGGGGNNPPPAPVNPFNPAFNNPAYNTVVQLPPLTQIAPISQGMGSLLPNIVIIDPFTGQPVPR